MDLLNRAFLNPLFKREVLTRLRARATLWALAAYLIAPFIAIVAQWPSGQLYFGGGYQARDIVATFFVCQFVLVLLSVPISGAFAINREKENQTYDFLFTTLLPPWTISMSKLAAILFVGFLLLVSSLPALSFVFFLGGVDQSMLAICVLFLVLESLLLGTLSLFFSALFNRGYVALIATYLAIFFIGFGLVITLENYQYVGEGFVYNLISTIDIFLGGSGNPPFGSSFAGAILLLLFSLMIFVVLMPITIWLTRKPPEEKGRAAPRLIESPVHLEKRRKEWPYYLIDPAKRPDPIADGVNPLVTKERLTNPMFRTVWRWRMFYLMLGGSLLAVLVACWHVSWSSYYHGNLANEFTVIWLAVFFLTVGWTLLTHALAFTGEHEGGTIETLKLTGLTSGEFLRGKWLTCWQLRWPSTLITILLLVIMSLALPEMLAFVPGFNNTSRLLTAAGVALLLLETAAMTATRAALLAKNMGHTLLLTFATLLLLPVVVTGGMYLVDQADFFGSDYFSRFHRYFFWRDDIPIVVYNNLIALLFWSFWCAWSSVWRVKKLWRSDA